MAKKPDQIPSTAEPQTQTPGTSTTSTTTAEDQADDQLLEPNADVKAAAKEQSDFITDFDTDEDDLGEDAFEEGKPVPQVKAPAAVPAVVPPVAQSREASTATPQLDANGQPIPPAPPAQTATPQAATPGSETPAQPAKTVVGEEAPAAQTTEQIQEKFKEWRGQSEDLLAKHHYALTPEQKTEMEANPAEFIPKMMSRVYLDAVTATLTQVTQFLPRMVEHINRQAVTTGKAENSFYERWPKLKDHGDMVIRVGQVYRSLNPMASAEDFINEVGAQTMVALRLSPEEIQAAITGGKAAKPAATAAAPFRPATSTPSGGIAPAVQKNPFDALADEFEEEVEET